jgi:hypothetical protein
MVVVAQGDTSTWSIDAPTDISMSLVGQHVDERKVLNLQRSSFPDLSRFHSEDEPRLQLEHPRRVDVCERRDCVTRCANAAHELTEGGGRCGGITVGCDATSEKVPVIEEIEAL